MIDPTKRRLTFTFTVEVDLAAAEWIKGALSQEIRRPWLKNRLEAAIEQFVAWASGLDCFRVRVISGSVRDYEGGRLSSNHKDA
jgi:hypothetical protein